MSGAECAKLVRGKMGRFTTLDRCGSVVPGPLNAVVTEGLLTVTLTPTNDPGTSINVVNASGSTEVNDVPRPKFQYFTVAAAMTRVNPLLVAMLTSQETWEGVVDGTVTGFTIGDDADPDDANLAMELWSGLHGQVCQGGVVQYGYFLTPWLGGGQVDAITWANDAINFTVTGMTTLAPNDWGVGPWDVTLDEDGEAAPLRQALGTRKHFLQDLVSLAPPADECGAVAVGSAPTGATAGTPGAFTPSGSWVPANLAALAGVTASPATAWTTGQRVVLGDGSTAHWSSTAWVAGPA